MKNEDIVIEGKLEGKSDTRKPQNRAMHNIAKSGDTININYRDRELKKI